MDKPKLSKQLEEKLNLTYEAFTKIQDVFRDNEITFITNKQGEAITLFIGKRREDGLFIADRFVRTIKRMDGSPKIKYSYWEFKGKVIKNRR